MTRDEMNLELLLFAAVLVAAIFAQVLQRALGLPVAFDGRVLGFIGVGSIVFAALGSLYPRHPRSPRRHSSGYNT